MSTAVTEIDDKTGERRFISEQPLLNTPLINRTGEEMKAAAALRTDLSIETLEGVMRSPLAKNSDKITAANSMLDRAFGKSLPQQLIDVGGGVVINLIGFGAKDDTGIKTIDHEENGEIPR